VGKHIKVEKFLELNLELGWSWRPKKSCKLGLLGAHPYASNYAGIRFLELLVSSTLLFLGLCVDMLLQSFVGCN
jgi:hypothetical protein